MEHSPQHASPGKNRLYIGLALVVGLALGLIGGYGSRMWQVSQTPVVVVVTATPQAAAQSVPPVVAPASATATPTIMEFLLADARHIQGNANAPVTIIEFSDFK